MPYTCLVHRLHVQIIYYYIHNNVIELLAILFTEIVLQRVKRLASLNIHVDKKFYK